MNTIVEASRPKQWLKNVLVIAAPAAAGVLQRGDTAWRTAGAFVAFCMLSSSTYLVNDLVDIEADQQHPKKRNRAIASGRLPVSTAILAAIVLGAVAFGLGWLVRPKFALVLAVYLGVTLSYTAALKRVAVVDIVIVASLFVVRAVGGAVATQLELSQWFLIFTCFGSLFVVAGKRYAELLELGEKAKRTRASLDAYDIGFLRTVLAVAISCTMLAYCIWAFEKQDAAPNHDGLYLLSIAPMLAALLRYLLMLDRGQGAAPEDVFWHDRALQAIGVVWAIIFAAAVYAN